MKEINRLLPASYPTPYPMPKLPSVFSTIKQNQSEKQMVEEETLSITTYEKFKKLEPEEKYLYIIEQSYADQKKAIRLLAIWLKGLDQKNP